MHRNARLLAVGLLLTSCAGTVRAQTATPASREELQKVYIEFLKQEGYVPDVNSDGNVEFKYEGGRYLILIDPKDRNFFALVFPGFWKVEGEEDRRKALAAANQASMGTKVAKVFIGKATAIASFECFVKEPADFSSFFRRALAGIRLAVKTFADEMNKK
ncbi:MAG TPA: hypothetical protein VLU43_12885 [Anaeromyxobacteraceae bacterium]|nr:hypothetical protein [Anaeromyxobacteraceae bacterium]